MTSAPTAPTEAATPSFNDLNLSEGMNSSLTRMGFKVPSAIQHQSIPLLLNGSDMIGQAETGTGKTAAFGIPIIEQLYIPSRKVQALVLCPTRELAQQVTGEINSLLSHHPQVKAVSIYGGEPIPKQVRALQKRPLIVVGTPGRVMDMMSRGHLRLGTVRFMVLDEADEMLDMGFRKDIEHVLGQLPEKRQTILFSATMSDAIKRLAKTHLTQPAFVKTSADNASARNITQHYLQIDPSKRRRAINQLITDEALHLAVIFCNTKRQVDKLTNLLQKDGLPADGIHGGLTQSKRNRIMGKFRQGTIQYLVATDVAARGIDVKNIDAVFNYDLPKTSESYVHRIGRTGRAEQSGKAYTFINAHEKRSLRQIERHTKSQVLPITLAI